MGKEVLEQLKKSNQELKNQNDLISRQAAIKYLMTNMNWYDEDGYESDEDYKRECITELINGVPSAQPETPYCDYCHEDSDGFAKVIEKNGHAVIHGEWLHLKANQWRGKVQIKYCPMCGRRLKR